MPLTYKMLYSHKSNNDNFFKMDDKDNNSQIPAYRPELKADHSWYESIFTQLVAPLVATRYLLTSIKQLNPFNFLKEPVESISKHLLESEKIQSYFARNFEALGTGTLVASIVGMYTKNTLHDIKSVYAEAVGYEFNKKPEDITIGDLSRSKNKAVDITRTDFGMRTVARAGMVGSFFMPWHKLRGVKENLPKYVANNNVGIGATGADIYGEGYLRRQSFFDLEQKIVSNKIKHQDSNPYDSITSDEILSLLLLQRRHLDKNYKSPSGVSEEGQSDIKLAKRIAELMNQTYNNTPHKEQAHFTVGKLNFLIGFDMLDSYPESLAFVELANKSKDMSEVKQAATAIRSGQNSEAVFARYGIDMASLEQKSPTAPDVIEEKFSKQISPRNYQDFAAQTTSPNLSM